MARINTPVDHMFRAGQISSKEWGRLSMKQPSKFKSQKSKMAEFEQKTRDEGDRKNKAIGSTKPGHINGPNQGMGKPAHFGGKPSKGGSVGKGKGGQPTTREINQAANQKPNFPAGGAAKSGNARKTLGKQQPSSSNANEQGRYYYGGPNSRRSAPERLPRQKGYVNG